jgi:DNA-binding NtrC family response regulator
MMVGDTSERDSGQGTWEMIGNSPPMRQLKRMIARLAGLPVAVLVRGESGTGKELVASALHRKSKRSQRKAVRLNAASLGVSMAPSMLFGHVAGAFTGAVAARQGAFRKAHRSTLFIDEIAAMPREVQASLLRVVEDGCVQPVGADESQRVDVRLVTATCEPLEQHVSAGRFRSDLFQRLAAVVVEVPPLRDRGKDLELLAWQALRCCPIEGKRWTQVALERLRGYRFPGNVRELHNVTLQAALLAEGACIELEHVDAVLRLRPDNPSRSLDPSQAKLLLRQYGGNTSRAARAAGLPRSTFRDALRRAEETGHTLVASTEPASLLGRSERTSALR